MQNTSWTWLAVVGFALSGCGGLSDVDSQDSEAAGPTADAAILNHPFTKDSSGNVTANVRSGTEVFLSGKDSDGTAAPVLRFEWCQRVQNACVQPSQSALPLVTRNNHTVSFTAPSVTEDTQLQFRLTVTDAKGKTDTKDVDVTIVGVPDSDHFLSYKLDDTRQIKLVAIGSRPVAGTELTGDVGFAIEVRQLVNYTTDSADGPFLEVGTQTFQAKWLAGYGIGNNCGDPQNPSFLLPIPALDMDDIVAKVGTAHADLEPNPALVDRFRVKLQIAIQVTDGALPVDVTPLVCADRVAPPPEAAVVAKARGGQSLFKQSDFATGVLDVSMEELMGVASTSLDTLESATAYYAAIDPERERTDLAQWLAVNDFILDGTTSFTWSQLAEGSAAHGAYTNNFDLGFGRDMYARVVRCDDGTPPVLGQPLPRSRIGKCDIAAVVINYASLEAATKHLNPVLAVAMEYSVPRNATRRIVQFYTFAPDSVTGKFERVASANLDGRGEKYMPQVCTVCHGGVPGGLTAGGGYQNGGDVDATFLPWDLDSFLFADTQGNNADRTYSDASLRHLYTRDAQSEAMRRLNQIAYLTFSDVTQPNRFTLPRQLLEGWYGVQADNAFANSAFNGNFVPAGWTVNGVDGVANTADDNPTDAPTIYRDVFARYCRACHIAHVPADGASNTHLQTLTVLSGTSTGTFNTCDATLEAANGSQPAEPLRIGIARQLPVGCYRQLINAPALTQRLSAGAMPFARLTMDRLWVSAQGTAPGELLQAHLSALPNLGPVEKPGTASAQLVLTPTNVDVGEWLKLQLAPSSRFVGQTQWSVCRQSGGTCTNVPIVGGTSREAHVRIPASGTFVATLTYGQGASLQQSLSVEDLMPAIGALPSELTIGRLIALESSIVSGGNGAEADHVWWLSGLENLVQVGGQTCVAQSVCRLGNVPELRIATTLTTLDAIPANNRGRFTIHARDLDGSEVQLAASLDINGTLSLAPLTGRVAANAIDALALSDATGVTLDLLQGNTADAAAGETLRAEIQGCPSGQNCQPAGVQNYQGVAGSARLVGTQLRYTPPSQHATHPPSGVLGAHPADTLVYRLAKERDGGVIETSSWTQILIRVRAPVSFETHVVNGIMKSSGPFPSGGSACLSCHRPGVGYDYAFNDTASSFLRYDWSADQIYARLQPDSTGRSQTSGVRGMPYVDLSTSTPETASMLYVHPSSTSHTGSDRNPTPCPSSSPVSCDDLANIRQWILSGANRF